MIAGNNKKKSQKYVEIVLNLLHQVIASVFSSQALPAAC